jgi:hypothetical protein
MDIQTAVHYVHYVHIAVLDAAVDQQWNAFLVSSFIS